MYWGVRCCLAPVCVVTRGRSSSRAPLRTCAATSKTSKSRRSPSVRTRRSAAAKKRLELLAAGSFPEALSVAERAEQEHPNDVGILIHLALAQFLNHSLEQASRSVQRALELSAADTRAKALKRRIDEVIAGVRPPPRSLDDVEQSDG